MDIPALARTNVDVAWSLIESVLTASILRLDPNPVYDSTTDTTTPHWASQTPLDALFYEDSNLEVGGMKTDEYGRLLQQTTKRCLIRGKDINFAAITDSAQIEEVGGPVWRVTKVEAIPTQAISILFLAK